MLASRKESILNSIFRIWSVPQEAKSSLVKHGQVARHRIVEFLCALTKEAELNCSLTSSERLNRRHNVPPLHATLARPASLQLFFLPPHSCCKATARPQEQP